MPHTERDVVYDQYDGKDIDIVHQHGFHMKVEQSEHRLVVEEQMDSLVFLDVSNDNQANVLNGIPK